MTSRFRIVSWNVNSIRQRLRAFATFSRKYSPDVLCLQETKVVDPLFPREAVERLGYHVATAGQKGYHGVAILSREPIVEVERHDIGRTGEARHILARLASGLEVHSLYVPAGGPITDPARSPVFARKLAFLRALRRWAARLADRDQQPRVIAADMNVAPFENDVWDHRAMLRTTTHTPKEVELLLAFQRAHPFVDVARRLVPAHEKTFTWWSFRAPDWRHAGKGRRLDHLWVSPALAPRILDYAVALEVRGWRRPSDHAPIMADLAWPAPASPPR
ncbi:MAG: exodeoxyribonuclease III [Polyangiaceae bacterium]